MSLPLKTWATNFPTTLDTLATDQPTLTNESVPGAGDGDESDVSQINTIRDICYQLTLLMGSDLLEAGSVRKRLGDVISGTTLVYAGYIGADAVPTNAANGFLKRNAANSAWEEVAYGTAANTVCVGNDSRLSNDRNPTSHASSHNAGGLDALTIDAAAGTGSLRTLGTSATSACAGNDSRLSDPRAPTGAVGGDLAGTYPSPTVSGLRGRQVASTAPNNAEVLTWSAATSSWGPAAASGGTDALAFHTTTAAEINGLTEKTTTASGDLIVIEDSADINNKKKVKLGNNRDSLALHGTIDGELNALASKTSTVSGDVVLIEDSQDNYRKKKIALGDINGINGMAVTTVETTADSSAVTSAYTTYQDITCATGPSPTVTFSTYRANEVVTINFVGWILQGSPNKDCMLRLSIDGSDYPSNGNRMTGQTGAYACNAAFTYVHTFPTAGSHTVKLRGATSAGQSWNLEAGARLSVVSGSGGTDSQAFHTTTAAEISGLTAKSPTVSGDLIVIEDSAASNAKKKVLVGDLRDSLAIHGTMASELSGLPAKTATVSGDLVVIEDSANGYCKKKVAVGDMACGMVEMLLATPTTTRTTTSTSFVGIGYNAVAEPGEIIGSFTAPISGTYLVFCHTSTYGYGNWGQFRAVFDYDTTPIYCGDTSWMSGHSGSADAVQGTFFATATLAAGFHKVKIEWKVAASGGTLGTTDGLFAWKITGMYLR